MLRRESAPSVAPTDRMGDHAMVCRIGGEPISRHNALRDALFNVAAEAGLSPVKEGRGLLPGTGRRPADIFIRSWAGGRDAALDVTVIHPLQNATRRGAATTPGHALTTAYKRKMREAEELHMSAAGYCLCPTGYGVSGRMA